MWKCHKCGKPVYFAERKQSLGYNWHPECLRCEECGKRVNPGQHAEHKGIPYCHVPCYGALFGPQLFGHGTRVESHKSFGQPNAVKNDLPKSQLETKLKIYNQYFEGKSAEIRSREVNGRLILEGSLRVYWGVHGVIHLKEDDDQRTVTLRKRNSYRRSDDSDSDQIETSSSECSPLNVASATLPGKLDKVGWDEFDELLRVERVEDDGKLYRTMPAVKADNFKTESSNGVESANETTNNGSVDELVPSQLNRSRSGPDCLGRVRDDFGSVSSLDSAATADERPRGGSTSIRRRPGRRLSRSKVKRRCSINGHFYDRETSFFTPPRGSQMSVWVTSLVGSADAIQLLLEKYKVDSDAANFALFVVHDNGEQRRLRHDESPLVARVMYGPREDVARLYLMDGHSAEVSNEVAQFLNLTAAECRAILNQYYAQEEREVAQVRARYLDLKERILYLMQRNVTT